MESVCVSYYVTDENDVMEEVDIFTLVHTAADNNQLCLLFNHTLKDNLSKLLFLSWISVFCVVTRFALHHSWQEPSFKDIVLGFRQLTERELQMFPGYTYVLRVTNCFTYT